MANNTDHDNGTLTSIMDRGDAPKEEQHSDRPKIIELNNQSTKPKILKTDICEQHNICLQESNETESSKSDDWEDILDIKNSNDKCFITSRNTSPQNSKILSNAQKVQQNDLNAKNVQKNFGSNKKIHENAKIPDYIEIDDVLPDDITKISDLNLLEKSTAISKNLKFQFNKRLEENKNKFISWMIKSLEWIKNVMCELAFRNGQAVQQNNIIKKTDTISRNSYMFCEFGSTCRFNYSKDQKCYGQHYVYNLVYFDILDTLKYIRYIEINNNTANIVSSQCQKGKSEENKYMQEIKTSVNTITYVINHMYDELFHVKDINPKIFKEYENKTIKFKSIVNIKFKSRKKQLIY